MNKFFGAMSVAAVVAIVFAFFAVAPFALLWSINTLFGLGIAYSLKNLFAAIILLAFFSTVAQK